MMGDSNRLERSGELLHSKATSWGWPDDGGEGAQNWIERMCYEQGREDALKEALAHVEQIGENVKNPAAACDGQVQMVVGAIKLRLNDLSKEPEELNEFGERVKP